jgi:hypothetical protein
MENFTVNRYAVNILRDFGPSESPLRPEAVERMRQIQKALQSGGGCTEALSGPLSFPFAGLLSEPIKIVQSPRLTLVLYEAGDSHRQLHTDGRELPKEFDLPAYYGYSAGRWEGDTLVVETAGFNDKTFLDLRGHLHSDALHITERFHRRDFGHLDYEITFDDPKTFIRSFTIKIPHELMADSDIYESYFENEKDCVHIQTNAARR